MLPGNTGDPAAFTEVVKVRGKFGLARMVMAGDRGVITSARIDALREADDGYGWITALRAPAIKKLMADDGPLQMSLLDEQDLAGITSDEFPGERLVACRNPVLAAERARKREDLLAATERLLRPLIDRVQAGRLTGAAAIGTAVGKVTGTYKMAKHFEVTITDTTLTAERRQAHTDQDPPTPANPAAPARRSQAAQAKAARQHDENGRPYRSFRSLLTHLATLTRNQVRFPGTGTDIPVLTEPTSQQRQAFDLIGTPIPLALK